MSLFGFGTINGQLKERVSLYHESVLTAAQRNMKLYRRYRHLLQSNCYQLIPAVDPGKDQNHWLAVEFAPPSGQEAVVLAFRVESKLETVQLLLRGLLKDKNYDVNFANEEGPNLRVTGNDLLTKGITVSLERPHMSNVVLVQMS